MNRILGAVLLCLAIGAGGCRPVGFARFEPAQVRSGGEETVQLAGLKVSVWRPEGSGPAPLVVFSHGFHGNSTQSTFLMKALAEHGYLVVAPNHKDAGRFGSARPEVAFTDAEDWTDSTYKDRRDDIVGLLKALKQDRNWNRSIDWSRVALAGHSLGGYTVLGLAGAWPSWKAGGIKAVLALSPFSSPFTKKKTLGSISVPVMYQTGTKDIGIAPNVMRSGGAFDQTPAPALLVEFSGAGHLAWTDLRPDYQQAIDDYCVAFLDRYVKGDKSADPGEKHAGVAEIRAK